MGKHTTAHQPQQFRDALAKFATGVTIMTVNGSNGPVGVTINSFASVSLDPPLVLWSMAKSSARLQSFQDADQYAIHILREDQNEACMGFTKQSDFFEGLDVTLSDKNPPLIENCVARFVCTPHAQYDGGDHTIFVSRVIDIETNDHTPMIFFNKSFGRLQTRSTPQ
jgi:flavin reductase (DIM6/NTAB) family NADH-FMN oxidoreductase RutF